MCFRYLNSGLRFLVTLVLILALAFFTCGVFIVFCRKCDDKVCTTIKFLTRASKISLPQTKKNSTPPDKGKYHSPRQRKITLPQTKKISLPRTRKISLSQTKENISPPDKKHGTVSNVAAPGRELPPGSHRNQVCCLQLKSAESRVGWISSVRRILEK